MKGQVSIRSWRMSILCDGHYIASGFHHIESFYNFKKIVVAVFFSVYCLHWHDFICQYWNCNFLLLNFFIYFLLWLVEGMMHTRNVGMVIRAKWTMYFASGLPCTLVDANKAFPGSGNKWDITVKELIRGWKKLFGKMVPNYQYPSKIKTFLL